MPSHLSDRLQATGVAGERLDRCLALALPALSRARFQRLIADGRVAVEGKTETDPGLRLRGGESIAVEVPPAVPARPVAESIPLAIVYEDQDLIVIDKPAGLVVHPAAGHHGGTLVNALIAHCGESLSGINGEQRPGIVHRLDKDTTGLMVVAKSDLAHRGLSQQFQAHGRDGRLERSYTALVWGAPERKKGTIAANLARSAANRQKIAVSSAAAARHAVTRYEVLTCFGKPPVASLVRCSLETGRTHQIRVHMAHIGHPLLGDATYGAGFRSSATRLSTAARAALKALNRQALHAEILGFEHPRSGRPLHFASPPPDDLAKLMEALKEENTAS